MRVPERTGYKSRCSSSFALRNAAASKSTLQALRHDRKFRVRRSGIRRTLVMPGFIKRFGKEADTVAVTDCFLPYAATAHI